MLDSTAVGLRTGLLAVLLSVVGLQAQTNQADGVKCQIKFCDKPVQLLALAPRTTFSSKSVAGGVSAAAPIAPDSPIDRKLVKPLPRVQWGSSELPRDPVTGKIQGWVLLTFRF